MKFSYPRKRCAVLFERYKVYPAMAYLLEKAGNTKKSLFFHMKALIEKLGEFLQKIKKSTKIDENTKFNFK